MSDMNEVFDKLRNLQEILSQEYELQSEMDEAPKELSSQEAFLESLKKVLLIPVVLTMK